MTFWVISFVKSLDILTSILTQNNLRCAQPNFYFPKFIIRIPPKRSLPRAQNINWMNWIFRHEPVNGYTFYCLRKSKTFYLIELWYKTKVYFRDFEIFFFEIELFMLTLKMDNINCCPVLTSFSVKFFLIIFFCFFFSSKVLQPDWNFWIIIYN